MDSDKVITEDSAEAVIDKSQITTVINKVSSNNSNYINDDLAFHILSKLPIKSLKRFGCVQKSWSNLFENSNSNFMNMFRNHFISSSSNNKDDDDDDDSHHTFLLLYRDYERIRILETQLHLLPPDHTFQNALKLNLPIPPLLQEHERSYIQILGLTSVNGILCFKENFLGGDLDKVRFVLWNPSTHEFVVLPPSPDESLLPHPLDFHTEYHFHGFGYDIIRDDFKVFQYVTFKDWEGSYGDPIYHDPLFGIYSLTNNSWRILDIHMPYVFNHMLLEPEVYLDGMCHLLLYYSEVEMVVFSFDLSHEVTFMTPFDKKFDDALFITPLDENSDLRIDKRRHLVALNGSIALISDNECDTTLHISILGELGVKESWIKLFIINPIPSFQWDLIGVGKKGYIFFRKEDGELAWLDLSTQLVEEIGVKADENTCKIGIYKESLISIRGLNN